MTVYEGAKADLAKKPKTWLVTGVAGFIGSHLLEDLLLLEQSVVGLDDFSTGCEQNLENVRKQVSPEQWGRFKFIKGDIRRLDDCRVACDGIDYVLHQAALGSVPRSIDDPITTNEVNVGGFLNILVAARDAKVRNFVYAASSSTYGDHPSLPKVEDVIGSPLSPYAVTKYVDELYADVFWKTYHFSSVGLRYFNVFGPRQNPNGAYAAVIPRWIESMLDGKEVFINGDGSTSRDFCFVKNVVQANILASLNRGDALGGARVYNVACHGSTTLTELFEAIKSSLSVVGVNYTVSPKYREFRQGDVRHSLANIEKIQRDLGYRVLYDFSEGLKETVPGYLRARSMEI